MSQIYANKISSSIIQCFKAVLVRSIFLYGCKDVLPAHQNLVVYQYKYRCWKTIQRLAVRIVQHVPVRRYKPVASGCLQAHNSAINENLLNSGACRTDYSPEFFSVLDILEYVVINIQRPAMLRQRKLIHKLALFEEPVANSTPNFENGVFCSLP